MLKEETRRRQDAAAAAALQARVLRARLVAFEVHEVLQCVDLKGLLRA
jgi:hypothetical protein